jgi:chromate transport protein ChrA
MVVFGLILLIIGFVLAFKLLWTIGMIVLLVGLVLWALGASATPWADVSTTTNPRVLPDPRSVSPQHRPGIFSYARC